MVSDPDMESGHSCGEIFRTYGAVRIEKEKRIINACKSAAGHCPVSYLIMYIRRPHVIYIL